MLSIKWIKPAIISGVILVSLLIAFLPDQKMKLLVMAGFLGIGGAAYLLQHQEIGPALLVAACMAVPFSIGTGSQSSINAGMLALTGLIGLWVFTKILLKEPIRFVSSTTFLPLMLMVVVAFLAFLIGQLDWLPTNHAPIRAQIGGLFLYILAAGAFLLAAHQFKSVVWLEVTTWVFVALGAVYVIGAIIPQIGRFTRIFYSSEALGSVFWLWITAIPFSQALFNRDLKLQWRLALFGLLALVLYVSVYQNLAWSSGWVPALAAMVVIVMFGNIRLGIAMGVVGGAAVLLALTQVSSAVMGGDNVYSLDTRLAAWMILLEILKVNPVLGLGPANYYWYTPLFHIMGYYVSFNSHNNYIDMVAQTGLLGLFCFLWFSWRVGWLGLRLKPRVPEGFLKAFVVGAVGGLAGTLVAAMLGDWVIPFVYNVGFTGFRASLLGWLFLGALVAIEQIVDKQKLTNG